MSLRRFLITAFSLSALSLSALLFSIVCFLIIPPYGGLLGLIFSVFLIGILVLIGDKILLAAIQARPLGVDNDLISTSKNLSCHLEMEEVSLFCSAKCGNNLYFFDGPLGKSSIVIGDELFKILSFRELKAVLYQALCMIKKGEGRLRVFASLPFIPFCFLFSGKNHKGCDQYYCRSIISFFLFPMSVLRDSVLKWREEEVDLSKNRDFLSSFFKIRNLGGGGQTDILEDVIKFFTVVQNDNDRLISSLVGKNVFKQHLSFK